MGFASFTYTWDWEDVIDTLDFSSESFDDGGLDGRSLRVAVKYHPRPGMYSYWPGSGVVQYSVTLVGRSVLGERNHLCGWNTF